MALEYKLIKVYSLYQIATGMMYKNDLAVNIHSPTMYMNTSMHFGHIHMHYAIQNTSKMLKTFIKFHGLYFLRVALERTTMIKLLWVALTLAAFGANVAHVMALVLQFLSYPSEQVSEVRADNFFVQFSIVVQDDCKIYMFCQFILVTNVYISIWISQCCHLVLVF